MSDMAEKTVSPFSRRFASALRGYMRERGISQRALAAHIDRSHGFVSEHLSGQRAVDTDMLDAVAELAEISSGYLYEEVGRRMTIAEAPAARDDRDGVAATAARMVETARGQLRDDQAGEKAAGHDEDSQTRRRWGRA